jgi:Possible lysine decarboxylase
MTKRTTAEAPRRTLTSLDVLDMSAFQARAEIPDSTQDLPLLTGTVEEIVEIMTWAQLGQHRKPMVLVNIKGFWAPMMAMLDHIRSAGFLHRDHLLQPIVVDRAEDVIPAIVAAAAKESASEDGVSSIIDKM